MTESNNQPTPTPAPKKRKWLKVCLSLLTLLLLLILILPTLLSTGPGNRFLLGIINGRLHGTVSADSISLGYFTPIKVHGIKVLDAEGQPIASLPQFNTQLTLLNLLRQKLDGQITLQLDQVQFIRYADGTTNVSRLLNPPATPAPLEPAPKPIIIESGKPMTINITGSLTSDDGLRKIRMLTVEPATWNFQKITAQKEGFVIGPGSFTIALENQNLKLQMNQIPINGGEINLATRIDLQPTIPVLHIDQEQQVVTNLSLNQNVAAGPLAFLPLAWGVDDKSMNLLTVHGQLNLHIQNAYLPLDKTELAKTGTLEGRMDIDKLNSNAPMFDSLLKTIPLLKLNKMSDGLQGVTDQKIENVVFYLKDGKFSYENFFLNVASVGLDFSGSVGLDNSLAMKIAVRALVLKLPLPIEVGGTVQKPKVKLPKMELDKKIEKAIPDLFDNLLKSKKKKHSED